jgi:Putative prokaryotic signal transducing protein
MQFVQLGSFGDYISAHIRLGMLQSAGIHCYLKDEYTLTVDPLLNPALGGMKLMVDSTQLQQAMDLLNETENNG